MPSTPIDFPNQLEDYKYLLQTIHKDDEDHKLYRIIKTDIIDSDADGEIIVGYRQRISPNNK